MKQLHITFKTKPFPVIQPNNSERLAINLKKRLTRADCNLCPTDHPYFNSDLFPAMLNGAYRRVMGTREWCYLDALPEGVSVDTSKFLAVVTVPFEDRRTR